MVPPEEGGVAPLVEGDHVSTDHGELGVVEIPGHSKDSLAFQWTEGRALFVGDLVLGRGNTTWLGEYPGCIADYLASLRKVRELDPDVIYPAHGRPITSPQDVLDLFERHRLERIAEVVEALEKRLEATADQLVSMVYGRELPARLAEAARSSAEVILFHIREGGGGA